MRERESGERGRERDRGSFLVCLFYDGDNSSGVQMVNLCRERIEGLS